MSNVRTIIISFENEICARCLCVFVKSVINTRTKNPQIFVQEAQKSEDSSFAKPGKLCETPTPGIAEKSDHRSDYLAEMLTRSKRRQDRQRARCFAVFGLLLSPLSAASAGASLRNAPLCLGVANNDSMSVFYDNKRLLHQCI